MSTKSLVEFLRQQRERTGGTKKAQIDVQEWLGALEGLRDRLRAALDEPIRAGVLAWLPEERATIQERGLTYDVPVWAVGPAGTRRVWIRPVGTDVIGAKGRVDVYHGPRHGMLLWRGGDEWTIRAPGQRGTATVPLTADSFADLIQALLS